MLSDEEKKEMLEDANSESRRVAFARARTVAINRPMTWDQYFRFLRGVQNLFPQQRSPKKVQGNRFKL